MDPNLSPGAKSAIFINQAKKTALVEDGQTGIVGSSVRAVLNLVVGPNGNTTKDLASNQGDPRLIGQRPVVNQFQDALSASLNKMRLILPIGEGNSANKQLAKPIDQVAPIAKQPAVKSELERLQQLDLPEKGKTSQSELQAKQLQQTLQNTQLPLAASQHQTHAVQHNDTVPLSQSGVPLRASGKQSHNIVIRFVQFIAMVVGTMLVGLVAVLLLPFLLLLGFWRVLVKKLKILLNKHAST